MSDEKRRKKRLTVSRLIHVRVIDQMSRCMLGKLANLHDEGFMLISSVGLVEDDHIYQLVFEDDKGQELFRLGAECLWINNAAGEQLWAGFQIIDLSDDDGESLSSLITQIEGEQEED